MDKSSLIDSALAKLMDDMDGMEGEAAMKHSMDDCPDPLSCTQHDDEIGDSLTKAEPAITIAIHKPGPESEGLDGIEKKGEGLEGSPEEGADEGLSPEEAELLRKLVK